GQVSGSPTGPAAFVFVPGAGVAHVLSETRQGPAGATGGAGAPAPARPPAPLEHAQNRAVGPFDLPGAVVRAEGRNTHCHQGRREQSAHDSSYRLRTTIVRLGRPRREARASPDSGNALREV